MSSELGGPTRRPPWPEGTFLDRLSMAAQERVLRLGGACRYDGGQVLVREGERSDFVIVLLTGVVKVTAHAARRLEALIAIRSAGDIIGEMATADGSPRSASVTACGRVSGRRISHAELRALVGARPEVGMVIAGVMAERLRAANRRRLDFIGCDVKARLARILLELDRRYGRDNQQGRLIDLPVTQRELANLAGVAEVTVQRPLRELREAKIVETGRRRLLILDVAALRRVAAGPSESPHRVP